VNDAFDEVDRIDRLMSHDKANSPLSRVNREAAQHPVVAVLTSSGTAGDAFDHAFFVLDPERSRALSIDFMAPKRCSSCPPLLV
jgi:thiamine biosynthesis lipoprotein ApbE